LASGIFAISQSPQYPCRSPAPGASLREVERYHILQTLDRFDGDKKKAASTLGISLKTLYNRLNEYREKQ
jgi:DNA-binding NtrC family response regulator